MKSAYTVAQVAKLFEKSPRQMLRKLIADGVVEPPGRGCKLEVPLTRLLMAYPERFKSIALTHRLAG